MLAVKLASAGSTSAWSPIPKCVAKSATLRPTSTHCSFSVRMLSVPPGLCRLLLFSEVLKKKTPFVGLQRSRVIITFPFLCVLFKSSRLDVRVAQPNRTLPVYYSAIRCLSGTPDRSNSRTRPPSPPRFSPLAISPICRSTNFLAQRKRPGHLGSPRTRSRSCSTTS